ncbi:hypothetical protein EUZ85_02340 [Hahella sp. KA22]|uniref:hypothetical protein n=1 Tax=Hahella sp. KA22 TaxID=1628392 RepID=UPI000FDF34E4|nr:hypothetical protein [Hahella sp. KA22]AZZ95333.1 hypothetical protein ENC22_30630 [Hahella sp. KA22]QAY52978.1 hypothetical protein EUZ85_02340 [Hahella sp. KA22]
MLAYGYSYEAFIHYLDYAVSNGLISPHTARGKQHAVKRILSSQPADVLNDLRQLDIEDVCKRFIELQCENVNDKAKSVYLSRFRSSIKAFLAYMESKPASISLDNCPISTQSDEKELLVAQKESFTAEEYLPVKTMSLEFPVDENQCIKLTGIPLTLTEEAAERLSDVIKGLAKRR